MRSSGRTVWLAALLAACNAEPRADVDAPAGEEPPDVAVGRLRPPRRRPRRAALRLVPEFLTLVKVRP